MKTAKHKLTFNILSFFNVGLSRNLNDLRKQKKCPVEAEYDQVIENVLIISEILLEFLPVKSTNNLAIWKILNLKVKDTLIEEFESMNPFLY